MMMHTVRISDAVRCFLLNVPKGPNLACPRETSLSGKQPGNTVLWRETLASRGGRVSLVSWQGFRFTGLASAHAINGHRAWEIDRLFVSTGQDKILEDSNGAGGKLQKSWDHAFTDFLEKLVQEAGERSGERVMLRLPFDSPCVHDARLAGFYPFFEEVLLEGQVAEEGQNGAASSLSLDVRLPHDDYGLFQLFYAGSPQQVRDGLGSTFDQWRDSQNPFRREMREWVIREKERIIGWLGLRTVDGWQEGEVMYHPDFPDALPVLLEKALARQGIQKWLIPDYQEMSQELLLRRGLVETARYVVLVKTVAARVMAPGFAAVEA